MNSKAEVNHPGFWTVNRVILTLTAVIAISALGLSSCNSTDDSSKNGPGVASSNRPVNPNSSAPNASNAPAAFISLPQTLRDTKVQTRDGRILKHFQGFNQYSTPTLMRQAVEQALSEKG